MSKKDQVNIKTLQISPSNFAVTVSVLDHVTNFLEATDRNNVSFDVGISVLNSLTTLAFKTQLDDGSAEINILTTNIAAQVRIQNEEMHVFPLSDAVKVMLTTCLWQNV